MRVACSLLQLNPICACLTIYLTHRWCTRAACSLVKLNPNMSLFEATTSACFLIQFKLY